MNFKLNKKNYKKLYEEMKTHAEDLSHHLNDALHGHIHIKSLKIDYDIPEDAVSYHHWRNRIYIFVAASLLGSTAVLFSYTCDNSFHLFKKIHSINPLIPFLLTPFGLVFIRWITRRVFPGAEGSGIPQVVSSLEPGVTDPNALSVKAGIGKLIGTNLALLCGASVGREGPTVQIGAIIARLFTKILKAPVLYSQRSLILAGGAAGVSAAFNTPIAGIVFAIEELGKSFYEKETSVLLMAIVVSGLTALSLSGPYIYFGSSEASVAGYEHFYAIPLGLLGGVIGGLFSLCLIIGTKAIRNIKPKNIYVLTFIFGVFIAWIGYSTNGATYGMGYEEAKAILDGQGSVENYPLAKIGSTLFSYLSGVPGGIFSPTLSIGAGIGQWVIELLAIPHNQAIILFGMVAFFSGVIRSPITSVIIVSEMTHNHSLLLPLLLAALVAYGCSKMISADSLYHALSGLYNMPEPEPEATKE